MNVCLLLILILRYPLRAEIDFLQTSLSPLNSFTPIYNSESIEYYLMQRLYIIKRGGFTWQDLMLMPIWEKNYYYDKLVEIQQKEEEANKK